MITLNDVSKILVNSACAEKIPCVHNSIVILNDGRKGFPQSSYDICALVSHLADEKITSDAPSWTVEKIRKHFERFKISRPELGWLAEPPETVLERIFASTHN